MRTALLTLVLGAVAGSLGAQTVDRVLASVGGRIITLSDLRAARELGLVAQPGAAADSRELLDQLIDRMLMLEEVERYAPPEPDARAIDIRLEAIRAAFDTPEAYAGALRLSGMSEAGLRQWVRNDLRIRAYLEQRFVGVIEPTGEELESYVRQVRADLAGAGRAVDEEQLRRLARERGIVERRQALVREWVEGLRRRSTITYMGR